MTEDDEFNDDIDWGSIEMPSTPAVTPWKNKSTNRDGAPSLRECLQMAPVFSREGDIILEDDENNVRETLDVGDEVS